DGSPSAVVVQGALDASVGGGAIGSGIQLGPHCTLTIGGKLDARGTTGGVSLTAGQIVVLSGARILADSEPDFTTRDGTATIPPGTVQPAPLLLMDDTTPYCCGNLQVDVGEQCDDGNDLFCDGCTPSCTTERSCVGDGNPCTGDTCLPAVGCQPLSGPACA